MTDQAKLEAGVRLAGDLRRIRELRNMSIEDLHAETKIPRTLLRSFEETALFDHSQFNRVYLRSFVRTYAGSVGLSPEQAADALEAAFEGRYEGDIARKHGGAAADLDEERAGDEPAPHPPAAEAAGAESAPVEKRGDSMGEDRGAMPSDQAAGGSPQERDDEEGVAAGEAATASSQWAASSPPSRRRVEPRSAPRPRGKRRGGSKGWLLALVGLAIVALLIWLWVSVIVPSDETPAESDAVADVEADTATVEEEPEVQRPAPVLGDSIVFYVIAADGPVASMRVTVDDDVRRPYWIEEGDSMRFAASERIVFEEQLDVVDLNLQDYQFPTENRDDQGRIVVTRESAQEFLDEQVES